MTSVAWKSPGEQTPHLLAIAISDRDPKFTRKPARNLKSDGPLVEDQAFNILLAGEQGLGLLLNRSPESMFILARNPRLAHSIANCGGNHYELAHTVARTASTVRIFAADGSNKCIKRINYGTGEVANIYSYKNATETPVNVLLPDPYNDEKLFIIVWTKISHESVFTLVLLTCKDNGKWQDELKAEFYRANTETFDAETLTTSLCRAGKYIVCAVGGANRLTAFEYTPSNNELVKLKGEQLFDQQILHVDAANSTTGPLFMIAFADGTIRLYNQLSLPKETRLELQETFQVIYENVLKLLCVGDRLLVATLDYDEGRHCIWSFRLMGMTFYPERQIHLGFPILIECLCCDPSSNYIYGVNSLSNETLTFE